MVIPVAKYTFNNIPVNTTVANAVALPGGWTGYSQDGTTTNTVINNGVTNRVYSPSPFGLWKQNINSSVLYTDCDLTAVVDATTLWISPRVAVLSSIVPTGYGAVVVPDNGSGQGYVQIYKACGDNPFVHATYFLPIFSSHFKVRITITGLLVAVYLNDNFVGDFDFTGAGVCGADYASGYISIGPGFNNVITFEPGDVTPNFILQ